jgi:hypothetical protein
MTKNIKLNLTKIQWSIICGGLLGNLNLNFIGKNWRLRSGTQIDKDWLFKQYQYLENYCGTPPKQDFQGRWWFNTKVIPDLQSIGPLWYLNATVKSIGTKVIPFYFIQDKFNELSLATLFMGDGTKKDSGYLLCLDNFQHFQVIWLADFLKEKYLLGR